jgi:hypothetical protein
MVKNETVIVLPFFETTDTVRHALRESEFDIDVKKYGKQRSLLVMDSLKGYLGSSEGVTQIIKRAVEDAKISGKNGVSVLGDLGSFFTTVRITTLLIMNYLYRPNMMII